MPPPGADLVVVLGAEKDGDEGEPDDAGAARGGVIYGVKSSVRVLF